MSEAKVEAAYAAFDGAHAVPAGDASQTMRGVARQVVRISIGATQILGLWILNLAGVWVVEKTALPIPGNLLGMVLLYALLALGIVKLSWFEVAGSFLIRHLAFFFVPITVGLMNTGPLFATWGAGIMVTLALSAAIGIGLAGWISQILLRHPSPIGDAT
jgi:holin-like protein